MTKLGEIHLTWNEQGNVTLKYDDGRPNEDGVEEVYALGGAALIDHMLSTISSKNILGLCIPAIEGLIDKKINIGPISMELKKAKLEIHGGSALYTIFKPETKMFSNNQKLELSLIQMTLNTLSALFLNVSDKHQLVLRFRGYCIIASYEEIIRNMHETHENESIARKKAAQATAHFLNTTPNNLTEEKLKDIFKDSSGLIKKWENLPLAGNKPVLHF